MTNPTSKQRISDLDLQACRSWLVARGDSLARSRDMILMVDELLERRSVETTTCRNVFDMAHEVIKELHRQDMKGMRAECEGAFLRIAPVNEGSSEVRCAAGKPFPECSRAAINTALTYLTADPPMIESAIERLRETQNSPEEPTGQRCSICETPYIGGKQACRCNAGPLQPEKATACPKCGEPTDDYPIGSYHKCNR